MGLNGMDEYWVPEHVKGYLRQLGFALPLDDMEAHIRTWDDWMGARGDFYDYRDTDGVGRAYAVHRRSLHPAMRVCREWGSLLLNENVRVVCGEQGATDWLSAFFSETGFMAAAQATVVRAFGLGTGAFALWVDLGKRRVRIRHYDARMVIPLTWDEDGVTECAFVTRAFYRAKAVDQLQMHLADGAEGEGAYRIVTVCFDREGNEIAPVGVVPVYDTGSALPTFAIVKPAVANTRVDMSPYGQSVFADAIDAIQAVDLTFDALVNEVDLSKMRVFLSDVLFDRERDGSKDVAIPFGKRDCTVFRKVMSTEDTIQEFAPALRTGSQVEAFRVALQMLGDLAGFGITYFDFDSAGYVKTATEVSSDNAALMRNIRRHENCLEGPLVGIARSAMAASRALGESVPDEGSMRVMFDDSIVQDADAEKQRDMREVGVTMAVWEYRMKWYGEDEATARERAGELTRP
ncbi:hypothetical protein [Eggerthella sinensis]|jgi:A118 family predicted phage portal protein|uniref:Phage portal protein n=1 Tax=Eggerthella sinensis TaxID=242230 RepID=A0A3N0IY73_9ACTN|nr:hypothetical protein [Eggerthella sinensis]RDB69450.1 hypothetical protein C1876_06680 [Eggerthella sinensis]RNM41917.1 hypothetical protein DMP09_07320 [Eggerthella sinensis]